ncbi:MAG TPA: hypothetical protein VLZ09_02485, partial [Gaiellaceae bacterium]|nr:hypothetical protein [Gaiellaceae bacterium]
ERTTSRGFGRLASRLGAFNARVELRPDELRQLKAGLDVLIEPYATRNEADTPDGAASVRILAYFMPEASAP